MHRGGFPVPFAVLRSATNALADRPFYVRGPLVAGTALYSEATLYMADWIVCCGMESYTIVLNKRPKQNIKHSMQLLGLKCALQAGRCLAALVAVSIGEWNAGYYSNFESLLRTEGTITPG